MTRSAHAYDSDKAPYVIYAIVSTTHLSTLAACTWAASKQMALHLGELDRLVRLDSEKDYISRNRALHVK